MGEQAALGVLVRMWPTRGAIGNALGCTSAGKGGKGDVNPLALLQPPPH